MSIRRAAPALALVCLLAACGESPPPDFDAATAALRACPPGDDAWRNALGLVETEDQWRSLETLTAELSERCPERWEPKWLLAKCHRQLQTADPQATFGEAMERARRRNEAEGIAGCGNDLGWLAFLAGDHEGADRHYDEALQAARSAERIDLESFIRNNIARLRMTVGDFPAAREELEIAERGLQQLGRDGQARWLKQNRASILFELGDAVAANDLLEELHREAGEAEDAWTLDASALLLGNLHLARDDSAGARDWYAKVSRDDPELAELTDEGLGRAALLEQDWDGAIQALQRGIESARPRDVERALVIEAFLGDAVRRSGDRERARRLLERVVAEGDRLGPGESRWIARGALGKLLIEDGRLDAAVEMLEQAISIVEAQRAPLDPVGEGLHFLRQRIEPYVDLAVALARRDGSTAESAKRILDVLRKAQARALRHSLEGSAGVETQRDPATLQRGLARGELLLNYLLGEDHGILLAFDRRHVRAVPIEGRRALLEPLRGYREALRRPVTTDPSTQTLSETERVAGVRLREALLGPVESMISAAERIYVVPDRELALLPFAALPLGTKRKAAGFLGQKTETAVLPLAGTAPRWTDGRAPVTLGGRPTDSDWPELPWSAYELARLQELWDGGRSELLDGERFTLQGLRAAASRGFRTLHLATHATASTLDPRRCGVVLSGGEMLGIAEIETLPLDAALVVLSACRTGEGELLPGEGVIGLGWAFLRAGARGIVVSQWTVDDVASAKLMVAFHEGLHDGEDPVRALSRARRAIGRTHPHPAYWAPFVIVLRPV